MIVASVDVVPRRAYRAAAGSPIAHVAAQVILGDLVSPTLISTTALSNLSARATLAAPTPLPLPGLSTLPGLLPGLSIPTLLLALALRPGLLAGLAPQRILSTRGQRFHLIAEAFDVVKRSRLLAILRLTLPRFAWTQSLLRLVHLLAQLVETFADAFFCSVGVGIDSPAQPVGSPLHPIRQVGLVHASQGIAQF
jgi:hypothetical protein